MRHTLAASLAAVVAMSGLAASPAAAGTETVTVTGTTGSTTAPAKLDGTQLYLESGFLMTHGGVGPADPPGCDEGGSSTYSLNGSGRVEAGTGSAYYPGTFTMTGSVTIGAHLPENGLYGFPARSAPITSWTQHVTIVSGTRTIDITTTLDTTSPVSFAPNRGACYGAEGDGPGGESDFGWTDAYSGTLKAVHATTTYSATISDGSQTWTTTGRSFTRAREIRGMLPSPWFEQGSYTPQLASFFGGTEPTTGPTDSDSDGVRDAADNCPSVANPAQADIDGDGTGDACDSSDDRDADGDGVRDASDNCRSVANPAQADIDSDGTGDACDPDIDGDGLTNIVEIWLGCDPHKADSDGDGVGDWVEVIISQTSPVLADTHAGQGGDSGYLLKLVQKKCGCALPPDIASGGYNALVQYWYFGRGVTRDDATAAGYSSVIDWIYGTCGCGPDPDAATGIPGTVKHHLGSGGGLLWIIRKCGCLPWEDGSPGSGGIRIELAGGLTNTSDSDGDGLIDVIEIMLGCNPTKPDTDGDGLTDLEELRFGSDPTKADTDGDGLNDSRERDLGCDPRNADSDGDGLPDGSDPAPRGAVIAGECKPTTTASVVAVGTTVSFTGKFTTHGGSTGTGHIDLPGGSTSAQVTGSGTVTGTHTFTTPGVYTIGCRIVDVTGGVQTATTQMVVYDPSGGFVTGGGWIDSPQGAYRPDSTAQGPARFGFVSQYKKGATVPTGQTEFQFQTVGMNFHAGSYDWLVVTANHTRAQYKGTGTINGSGSYGFLLTAYDLGTGQGVDKFRIKIWDKTTGATVYDNRLGSPDTVDNADPQLLTQGQVVIHKPK